MTDSLQQLQWLEAAPALETLMERYPAQWKEVGPTLVAVLETGRAEAVAMTLEKFQATERVWKDRIAKSRQNPKVVATALPHLIKNRMLSLALKKCCLAAAAGQPSGKIRFNRLHGMIIQRLLFERQLVRKPVSLGWFRCLWPLLWQRRFLMPLVQSKGIYCFYSRPLVRALATLLGEGPCLEIGAGDGTLSRFLHEAGVSITATDDGSWEHVIQYPESVEKLPAERALHQYQPRAVVCSWPPPHNRFEQAVFSTPSVELYVVIGSRHAFASGNRETYEEQDSFSRETDDRLSALVLPPELDSAVLIFRRAPAPMPATTVEDSARGDHP